MKAILTRLAFTMALISSSEVLATLDAYVQPKLNSTITEALQTLSQQCQDFTVDTESDHAFEISDHHQSFTLSHRWRDGSALAFISHSEMGNTDYGQIMAFSVAAADFRSGSDLIGRDRTMPMLHKQFITEQHPSGIAWLPAPGQRDTGYLFVASENERKVRIHQFSKNGDAIERLAEVDVVVFDKTGTLTMPELSVDETKPLPEGMMQLAAGLAKASNHPLAVALAHARPDAPILTGAIETPGAGVKLDYMGKSLSLGSAAFVGCEALKDEIISQAADQSLMFFKCDDAVYPLRFAQDLRPDAVETIQALKSAGLRVIMLSGDQPSAVKMAAKLLNIDEAIGGVLPQDKIAFINSLQNGGSRVLMVGDGLNDAPALAAAHVSLSPVTAAHIAQNAADATFLGADLNPVVQAFYIARKAKKLMRQNLWLAVGYNILAVPVAIMGFVTPMIAALAMSGSSILVTLNALRAKGKAPKTAQATNKPTLPSIVQEPA